MPDTISGACRLTVNPPVAAGSGVTFEDESEPRAVAWRALHPEPRPVPPIVVRSQLLLVPCTGLLPHSYTNLCRWLLCHVSCALRHFVC